MTPVSGLFVNADGLDVTLTEEETKYLEEPYKPNKIIGHF